MEGVKAYKNYFFKHINKETDPEIVIKFYNQWKQYEEALPRNIRSEAEEFSITVDNFMKASKKLAQSTSEFEVVHAQISENCPPVGTQGTVMKIKGGWVFVYRDGDTERGLLIKPTFDKKLEVFSENEVYNRSNKITKLSGIRSQYSSCTSFIQFLDGSGEDTSAILVTNVEAPSYPDINYPEPPEGWAKWAIKNINTGVEYASYVGVIGFLLYAIYTVYVHNSYEALKQAAIEAEKLRIEKETYWYMIKEGVSKLVSSGQIKPEAAPGLLQRIGNFLRSLKLWN